MASAISANLTRAPGSARRITSSVLKACALALCLPLVGCGNQSMSDLHAYSEQVLARKSKKIEPLPEIKPYEVYTYQSSRNRDPFEPLFQDVPEQAPLVSNSKIKPDTNRNREELEAFALDSLRMVGTLEQKDQTWGLVVNPDGTVYRAQVGNYVGKNHGKIISILEDRIELTEIVPDGLGGYEERDAALALTE